MTLQLQQAIDLARSLPIEDQLELLKTLSNLIQQNHASSDDDEVKFSAESFSRSWHQAMTGQTFPLKELWEDMDE